jgi:MFS family permease
MWKIEINKNRLKNRRDILQIKLKWLCVLAFLNNVGYSCVWPLTTIYMHNELHESLVSVGIVLLFYSLSNVVGSYLAGMLFDKRNTFKLKMIGQVITLLSVFLLILENGWPAYPVLLCFFGFGTGWILTMINSLGTKVTKYSGTKVFNLLYLVENVGLVLGTAITGFIYKFGVSILFTVITCLYVISLVITWQHFRKINVNLRSKKINEKAKARRNLKMPKVNLVIIFSLLVGLVVIWVMYEQWMSNLSIYMQNFGISTEKYSLLWTLNGFLIVVFQLGVGYLSKFFNTLNMQIYLGTFFLSVSFIFLFFAHQYSIFVVSMVVLTMGEALIVPAVPAYVNELTTPQKKGKYQGFVNSFSSFGRALGPLFGGVIIENVNYKVLFIICIIANALLFVWYVLLISNNKKRIKRFVNN